ncbi:hypothetical protein CR513_08125, partial [Mucuna pruriens]
MGREPSLSVFFWFFSLQRANKVGWTLLSSWHQHKLMKPFRESYKQFNNHFFRVAARRIGRNLLFGLGTLSSPYTRVINRQSRSQLAKIIWKARRRSSSLSLTGSVRSPTLSYSVKDIATMKARSSRSTTPGVAKTSLLVAVRPTVEKSTGESPPPVVEEVDGSSAKRATEAGVLQSEGRPSKRGLAAKDRAWFEEGFAHALRQMAFIHPDTDTSVASPFKEVVDGKPSSPFVGFDLSFLFFLCFFYGRSPNRLLRDLAWRGPLTNYSQGPFGLTPHVFVFMPRRDPLDRLLKSLSSCLEGTLWANSSVGSSTDFFSYSKRAFLYRGKLVAIDSPRYFPWDQVARLESSRG